MTKPPPGATTTPTTPLSPRKEQSIRVRDTTRHDTTLTMAIPDPPGKAIQFRLCVGVGRDRMDPLLVASQLGSFDVGGTTKTRCTVLPCPVLCDGVDGE